MATSSGCSVDLFPFALPWCRWIPDPGERKTSGSALLRRFGLDRKPPPDLRHSPTLLRYAPGWIPPAGSNPAISAARWVLLKRAQRRCPGSDRSSVAFSCGCDRDPAVVEPGTHPADRGSRGSVHGDRVAGQRQRAASLRRRIAGWPVDDLLGRVLRRTPTDVRGWNRIERLWSEHRREHRPVPIQELVDSPVRAVAIGCTVRITGRTVWNQRLPRHGDGSIRAAVPRHPKRKLFPTVVPAPTHVRRSRRRDLLPRVDRHCARPVRHGIPES